MLSSCSKDEVIPIEILSNYEANRIASQYLALIDKSYKLNLTKEEAIEKKISSRQYNRMLDEVKNVNYQIKIMSQNGEHIYLLDPKDTI